MQEKGDRLAFVVLFGSMATGQWMPHSDYDLLVGLNHDDGLRLIDRIGEFQALMETDADVFPYSRSEWTQMFVDRHLLMLEALDTGVVLVDDGCFQQMRSEMQRWLASGELIRTMHGWRTPAGREAEKARK